VVLAADPFAKMVTSQLILMLPYARKEEEAKARTVYRRFGIATGLSLAVQGLAPMAAMLYLTGMDWQLIIFVPAVVFYALYMMMRSKIQGYTGDCCGATALIVELTIFIVACANSFAN
jgi:adenosylcobinamide-GDP ribazoletransferase